MKGGRYLLTGATGFLGKTIRDILSVDYQVTTLGRSVENDLAIDLSKNIPAFAHTFDVVIHNAGKAHVVAKTAQQRKEFEDVNVAGTQNLLLGLLASEGLPRAVVFISSIAVYGLTRGENISEEHPLAAEDPYGKSKIQAEEMMRAWCAGNGVSLTILRLPLIAAKNPPGNLGAMISGIRRKLYVSIAGGKAKKSIVLAEDVASFLPLAADNPGVYHLTDGYHPGFRELELLIAKQAGVKVPVNVPYWIARLLGFGGDLVDKIIPGKAPVTSEKIEKLVSTLTFDDTRARRIGWRSRQILTGFRIQ